MSDPRHRRSSGGGREADAPPSARELNREARRSARRTARRRILAATIAGSVIVAAAVVGSWIALRPDPPAPNEVVVPADSGASAMVLVLDGEGAAASLTLIASHPDHPSRVVLIPPSLLAVLPGFGEHEIAQAPLFDDADLAALAVANLLGVRIDGVVVHDAATLPGAIDRAIDVDLASPLIVDEGGSERVVAAEGEAPRTGEMLATLLTVRGDADEAGLLLRQGRVWTALMDELGGDGELADRFIGSAVPAVRQAVNGAAQDDDLVIAGLPVSRVDVVGVDVEQYAFDGATSGQYVQQAFPYLSLGPEPRTVVEILNGSGGVGVTQPVAKVLVEAGYHVLKTDNAGRDDYAVTQVVAQGRENQQAAIDLQRLLGLGEVVLELRQPSGVFDVTIIVGSDAP